MRYDNMIGHDCADVDFSDEQENQVFSVLEGAQALLMVLLGGKAGYDNAAHIGNVVDMVSEYLQRQGFETSYPSRTTEPDGYSYIEDRMAMCRDCQSEATDVQDGNSARYVINQGYDDQFIMCFSCHCVATDRGAYTGCDSCGAYFTGNHLLPNKDNVDGNERVREICPYCGEIWCD